MNDIVLVIIMPLLALMPAYAIASEIEADERGVESTIIVESEPPGAIISLNGVEVGEAPLSIICTDPGSYIVTGELKGFKEIKSEIDITSGETIELNFNMEEGESWDGFKMWVEIGILAAIVVAGLTYLLLVSLTSRR